jgi:hypothetical protein
MNAIAQPIVDQQPINSAAPQVSVPQQVTADMILTSALGGLGGYGIYWIARLAGMVGLTAVGSRTSVKPFIFNGVAVGAVIATAYWSSRAALYLLGDRTVYENLAHPEQASRLDRLRHHTWKWIGHAEKWIASAAVQRTGKIGGALLVGSLVGYGLYGLNRLFKKLGAFPEINASAIRPFPYILLGLTSAAVVEMAQLSHDMALKLLGKREIYENLDPSVSASAGDRLRRHMWKVIGRIERVPRAIDILFSALFRIRTMREIGEKNIVDCDPDFMEILRHAFIEQVHETALQIIPQQLGVSFVEACGYPLVGMQVIIGLQALSFIVGFTNPFAGPNDLPSNSGLINRVLRIHAQIRLKERAEAQAVEERAKEQSGVQNQAAIVNNNNAEPLPNFV